MNAGISVHSTAMCSVNSEATDASRIGQRGAADHWLPGKDHVRLQIQKGQVVLSVLVSVMVTPDQAVVSGTARRYWCACIQRTGMADSGARPRPPPRQNTKGLEGAAEHRDATAGEDIYSSAAEMGALPPL